MDEFDASRDAIREALSMLRDEGIIERRQGVGTLVVGSGINFPSDPPPVGASLSGKLESGTISPDIIDWTCVKSPRIVADRLDGVKQGDRCLCIDYVMELDGKPIAAITNYLRRPESHDVFKESFTTDFYSLLNESGHPPFEVSFLVEASPSDARTADLLKIRSGDPVTWFEQVMHTESGEAFDFATGCFRGGIRTMVTGSPRRGARHSGPL